MTNATYRSQLAAWMQRIEQAFRVVEEVPEDKSLLSFRNVPQTNQLRLMNLQVWCLRYNVSPEFVLRYLLSYFSKARRSWTHGQAFGVKVEALTGTASRAALEDMVHRTFPYSENHLIAKQSLLEQCQRGESLPLHHLNYFTEEEMSQAYQHIMQRRRLSRLRPTTFRRPWRGNPFTER